MTAAGGGPGTPRDALVTDVLVDRRRLLGTAAAAGALSALGSRPAEAATARWSDPATWRDGVPGRRDVAVVRGRVLLDVDVRVAGVVVKPGAALVFDPRRSRSLSSTGNVVVEGALVMRPARASVRHTITFEGVDEERFVGGGHEVLRSDVGLWVMHHGYLDVTGTPKRAWARAAGAVAAGATAVELDADPDGWRVGDEIVVTPTGPPAPGHHERFDAARVAAVDGRRVTLDRATVHSHPAVEVAPGTTLTAEVLNLTRNVRIGGTRGGRAHVFVHSQHPQTIQHAVVRHVGPRRTTRSVTTAVLGRYGMHFHHSYDGSRGSVVRGVVVRDCGNHSFVPHTSHGTTFDSCIAYDVLESPFWWDEGDTTHDTRWQSCVAARVGYHNPIDATDLTGFFLGRGTGNTAAGCVATGVGGQSNASGFEWPPAPAAGVWLFEDCVAHDNAVDGAFVWQHNDHANVVTRLVAYHNGKTGIEHGSFANSFRYEDVTLFGNAESQLKLHANAESTGDALSFERVSFDGGGVSPAGIVVAMHLENATRPARFTDCVFRGHTLAAVRIAEVGTNFFGLEDFVRTRVGDQQRDLEPGDFDLARMAGGGRVRVQRQQPEAYQLDAQGNVTPIPPFA
ncbi:MAG TPA: hypothetical protein VHJ34_08395 [Actinomycetota bacterium]|nr:hypothetical protein [Actinomycetota bacterium]